MALGAEVGPITLTFCPKPMGPKPDLDNCIAAFKAGQDGLADALRVNDRNLTVRHEMGERCKDGAVIVVISPPASAEPAASTTETAAPQICSPENGGAE